MKEPKVYEFKLKIYAMVDIPRENTYAILANYIDSYLAKQEDFLDFHETNCYKNYTFDQPYKLESDGIYKEGSVYIVRIRTVDKRLAMYFNEGLADHRNREVKGLSARMRVIPKKVIKEIYAITPTIVKFDKNKEEEKENAYWRNYMGLERYEERLKNNLMKKYQNLMKEEIETDFDLYTQISFMNQKPISVPYKKIRFIGDKVALQIADNETAQNLAYLAIGTGLGELNSRGFGFVNYRYL